MAEAMQQILQELRRLFGASEVLNLVSDKHPAGLQDLMSDAFMVDVCI